MSNDNYRPVRAMSASEVSVLLATLDRMLSEPIVQDQTLVMETLKTVIRLINAIINRAGG